LFLFWFYILQAHIKNFGSQSSPTSYAQQSLSPPPSLQAVDPVQAEQDASQLADAFQHAFVVDNMDEDEDSTGDKGNEDDEDNEMDDPEGHTCRPACGRLFYFIFFRSYFCCIFFIFIKIKNLYSSAQSQSAHRIHTKVDY
jgi:hypothetical protein